MKKMALALLLGIGIGFVSCKKEPQALTKTQIKQKVDSITTARIKEMDDAAKKDLELRITIEVSVKADSILNAKMHPVKKDSIIRAIPQNK